jgi:predicted P-loop ATPase
LFLRQCIFFGTTNKENFLTDETGNRRFLVVEVGANPPTKSLFDENAIEDFKQAWAQALHIYKTEQVKLILPQVVLGTAAELQEAARVDDGKIGLIEDYLQLKSRVCAVQIWYEALGEVRRPQKWEITELNNIIAGMPEWERLKSSARFGKYGTQRGFQRK